ncbi:hypothetical protein AB0I34_24025 [Kribbella sp. NPDC050281]|uniref:hypothetical protein n=1 Tax=Kribbella sp. NPDC050281 TaxID=3155515 RepID=UPI0033CF39F9
MLAGSVARARDHGRVPSDIDPDDAGGMQLAALDGGTILARLHRRSAALERSLASAIVVLTARNASTVHRQPIDEITAQGALTLGP